MIDVMAPTRYKIVKNNSISLTEYPCLYNKTEENISTTFLAMVESKIKMLYLFIFVILSPFIVCIFFIL